MRINMNGTTITGSVSEVLATLTHLGIKASDTKPVTLPLVTEIAVTDADDVEKVARSIIAVMNEGETVTPEATPVPVPKPARDSVIKMAIADVKDLLSRNYSSCTEVAKFVGETLWFVSEGGLYMVTDEVLFAINADKRTVVASIRYNEDPKDVYKQGRAKCAPGDVFNEHIGKAIALRRALGLEVPVEYYEVEARDSDDLAVGDVVCGDKADRPDYITQITELTENPDVGEASGQAFKHTVGGSYEWLASSQVTLINDSARHTAPDLEVSRIIRH